ncbi:MAG: rapid alkalinization factor family protein [Fibrobacteria bacterium]
MSITKTISTLSLGLALFGGAMIIAPSPVKAANNGFINYDALKHNQGNKNATRPGQPANKYNRGCSAINKCRG